MKAFKNWISSVEVVSVKTDIRSILNDSKYSSLAQYFPENQKITKKEIQDLGNGLFSLAEQLSNAHAKAIRELAMGYKIEKPNSLTIKPS